MRRGHAAAAACGANTATIFRRPSILRNMICPLAMRLKTNRILGNRQPGDGPNEEERLPPQKKMARSTTSSFRIGDHVVDKRAVTR